MAGSLVVAKRYARALYSSLESKDGATDLLRELEAFNKNFFSSAELTSLFQSPSFSDQERKVVLDSLIEKLQLSKKLGQFLRVLLGEGRLLLSKEIATLFKDEAYAGSGQLEAKIESAFGLSADELRLVLDRLEEATHKKVNAIVEERPELVAGLRITVSGKTFDMSLPSAFERVQSELALA